MVADDREPGREAPEGETDEPAPDEWDAYPLIVVVILAAVVLTVFELGPRLGGALLPGLVHH